VLPPAGFTDRSTDASQPCRIGVGGTVVSSEADQRIRVELLQLVSSREPTLRRGGPASGCGETGAASGPVSRRQASAAACAHANRAHDEADQQGGCSKLTAVRREQRG
jgi:hypothetical protein